MARLTLKAITSESFRIIAEGLARPIAEASTSAIKTAGETVKDKGRAAIASQGFSAKWQNALRVKYYPLNLIRPFISAAAFIFHKIKYAGVFESPTTITPRRAKFLWIPIEGVMKPFREARSPRFLIAKGVNLFFMRGTRAPLLATRVMGSKRSKARNLSLSRLKRGTSGKRGTPQTVPLFVGVESATVKKNFGILEIAAKERNNLEDYYNGALETD